VSEAVPLTGARSFIYQVVSFVMVGFALYALAHLYQLLSTDPIIKHTKKCKYCKQRINEKVRSSPR
jgi:large conductance mechanosensitive channel